MLPPSTIEIGTCNGDGLVPQLFRDLIKVNLNTKISCVVEETLPRVELTSGADLMCLKHTRKSLVSPGEKVMASDDIDSDISISKSSGLRR